MVNLDLRGSLWFKIGFFFGLGLTASGVLAWVVVYVATWVFSFWFL